MIVTDGTHIAGTTLRELHAFCAKAGIKRCWYHYHKTHPHYDKPKGMPLRRLLKAGAHLVSSKVLIAVIDGSRLGNLPYGILFPFGQIDP